MREIDIAVVKIPKEKKDNADFFKEKFAKLIDIAGGIDFVNKGDSVLVKVSLNSDRKYPATTSPDTLSALIELLIKRSPSAIYVGDKSAFFRKTKKIFKNTGFEELIAAYAKKVEKDTGTKVRLIDFDDCIYRDRYFPKDIKDKWELQRTRHMIRAPKMLFEEDPFLKGKGLPAKVDHIIVLGTVKTHFLGRFTLGMKSYVGFLDNESRCLFHNIPHKNCYRLKKIAPFDRVSLQNRVPELLTVIPLPKLVILDGRELIIRGGPDSNNRIQPLPSFVPNPYTGVMMAGTDIVAVDAAGVALLKTQKRVAKELKRFSIWEMPTFVRAEELKLGANRADKIVLHTDSKEEKFERIAWFLQ
ncbi:MAG: DUF362 domain-containing protein [Deltaproteobacteria bacterium]|uniref:DUF362 domain-containing protein n=1 Tax=Candidatus Zymogenus saltonus TaxID=2844893 RepID=A0A9D8KHE0_9DELT|nr:DUF362 domain-containing protein [Candidatus Zymogenus saltonus]